LLLCNIRDSFLLLATGVGIVLTWRGIWEVSVGLFDEKTSLVLGILILIGLAAVKKRKLFKIFGMGDI